MTLVLQGESRKAAAEQAMLNFFGTEPSGELISCLREGPRWTTATARIRLADGRSSRGMARASAGNHSGDYCIKESIYRAALPLMPSPPPWGSLAGIRPVKTVTAMLASGMPSAGAETMLRVKYHVTPERRELALECARAATEEQNRLRPGDISLYVGIPFCPSRCAYCSFVSSDAPRSQHLIPPFIERLLEEIKTAGETVRHLHLRPVTLYMGGGTPTVLDTIDLRRLLDALHTAFPLSSCREITVEAGRPDTLTQEKLALLRDCGVSRISVNPQTLRDEVLRNIGRAHTTAQTRTAFQLARETGFDTINADIIAGLPGDDTEGFAGSLDGLLDYQPENITVHTLALKKGAAVWQQNDPRPGGETVGQMLAYASRRLRESGYAPYYLYRQKFMAGGFENVGWTRPGHGSRYNLHMMEELTTVLAMGGGGVTKIVLPEGRIHRLANCKFPLEYVERYDKITEKLRRFSALAEGLERTAQSQEVTL